VADIIGTNDRDILSGTSGNDHIQGLGGDDSLSGGPGDDLMEGGDGADDLQAWSGSDIADGGAGDDRIDISNYDSAVATIRAIGGDGDDSVTIYSNGPHAIMVDGGAGTDQVSIALLQNGSTARLSLGAGSDSIRLFPFNTQAGFTADALVVTDFQTGAGGDRLEWLDFLGSLLLDWDPATNPFGTGHLRLLQSGTDVLLQIDRDAGGSAYAYQTLVRFENVSAADFVWQNLEGYPSDGSIPSGLTLTGSDGDDWLRGAAGGDTLDGLGGANRMWGGAGDDVIRAAANSSYNEMYGQFGNDRLEGGGGYDVMFGGDGDDQMYGGGGGDYLHDTDGNDLFDGGEGDDRFDLIRGSLHADSVTAKGGEGNDYFWFSSAGSGNHFTVDGGAGDDRFDVYQLLGTADLTLGSGVDTVVLRGELGDRLRGGGLITVADFAAGAGGDVVDVGDFFAHGDGANPFGDGSLELLQDGADTVIRAGGRIFMRLAGTSLASLTADNFGGYAPDGSAPSGHSYDGTEGADDLAGSPGGDVMNGLGADDRINGRAGDDTIYGGAGDDILDGGSGNDRVEGGDGADSVYDYAGNDQIYLGDGNDFLSSDAGSDLIDAGAGNDFIEIQRQDGRGGDVVTASAGDGNDIVQLLLYSLSTVSVDLGAGDDRVWLYGIKSNLTITLGSGADIVNTEGVFYSNMAQFGHISITDFNQSEGDRLDLQATIGTSLAGWDGTANPFAAGYLRLVQAGGDTRIEVDHDGPGGADPFFLLAELKNVAAGTLLPENFAGFSVPVVYGSGGDDVFTVDDANDQIIDSGGTDEVRTSLATYLLPSGFEKLTGTSASAQDLRGNALDNILTGGAAGDFVRAQDGGNDTVNLGSGNDAVYFGSAYTSADSVDGGAGKDQVALQGDYSGGVTLGTLAGVETLVAMTGSDTRFGAPGTSLYSYNIVSPDASVAAGTQLLVNASTLQAGENLTFDGHLESDGSFFIYGGKGVDTLTGGSGADVFFFAEDGRFAATDHVDGGGGADAMVLRGNYSLTLSGTSIVNVETVVLNSGSDARFYSAGTPFSYDITTADDTVASGQTMTFNGGQLAATETLHFDGSLETNGNFRLFGGSAADVIKGGAGNDLIYGGLGADTLTGGAGADVFRYQGAGESTVAATDHILDFASGDVIDLGRIDAVAGGGDDAFHLVAAFDGHAGQLVLAQGANDVWTVSGDIDGNGQADFQILVTVTDSHQLTGADFVL
jgi:Ca2+-binding RTX toxin-like protein